MSHTLTQPEEIALALRELEESEMQASPMIDIDHPINARAIWYQGYVSPYRATHMAPVSVLHNPV